MSRLAILVYSGPLRIILTDHELCRQRDTYCSEKEGTILNILDYIYPPRCPVCQDIVATGPGELICPACRKDLPYLREPRCMKCGKELSQGDVMQQEVAYCMDCIAHLPNYTKGFPLFRYEGGLREGVLAFKFHHRQEYARFFSRELIRSYGSIWTSLGIDLVIPVPVHPKKRKHRGYNQAELLAKPISRYLQVPLDTTHLIRIVNTLPQKELNPEQRAKNIKSAFFFRQNKVKLEKVLLVDDIYTTGVTVQTCTEVLLQAGAKEVYYTSICIGEGY